MNRKWLLITAGVLSVLVIVGLSGCAPGTTTSGTPQIALSSQQQGIWVSGEGKVSAAPDIATLSLGVQSQEATVADAQAKATQAMNAVMAALTANGIDKKDIQTQNFNISPMTKWDPTTQEQVTTGYQVTNTVTVKVRNLDNTGAIIDAVAQAGGDLTRVNSISYSIEDPTSYYAEARTEAVADAQAKAEQLAKLAGVSLGDPIYITESSSAPPIYSRGVAESAVPAPDTTPVSPGELDITLDVQITYAIK